MIRIAIAKGRVLKEVAPRLAAAGYDTDALTGAGRHLVRPLGAELEAMIVRSGDVPLFVQRGACGLGIAGLDVVRESGAALFELLDLQIARCRLALAAPAGSDPRRRRGRRLRVATKFTRLAAEALDARGLSYELISLGGAMETAPESGIADCIVDLVDTGGTLRAHGLAEVETFLHVSTRLYANPSAFYRRYEEVVAFARRLAEVQEDAA